MLCTIYNRLATPSQQQNPNNKYTNHNFHLFWLPNDLQSYLERWLSIFQASVPHQGTATVTVLLCLIPRRLHVTRRFRDRSPSEASARNRSRILTRCWRWRTSVFCGWNSNPIAGDTCSAVGYRRYSVGSRLTYEIHTKNIRKVTDL